MYIIYIYIYVRGPNWNLTMYRQRYIASSTAGATPKIDEAPAGEIKLSLMVISWIELATQKFFFCIAGENAETLIQIETLVAG
jgi:hypothetical protein